MEPMRGLPMHVCEAVIRSAPKDVIRFILQLAAIAPPALKAHLFERICSKLARESLGHTMELLVTNLGISSKLRCEVPLSKSCYAFGRPENALSERSTVALVK